MTDSEAVKKLMCWVDSTGCGSQ